MKKKLLMTLVLSTCWCVATRAQMIAANIDALWAAMMSPSVGLEMVVGEKSTVGLNVSYMGKPYGMDIKLFEVQPEYRYYFSVSSLASVPSAAPITSPGKERCMMA